MDTRPLELDAHTLIAMKPGQLYLSVLEPIMKKLSLKDGSETFLIQLDQVTEDQGLLLAAHRLQAEVASGGFRQLFANSTGMLAPEAVRGFELLRMTKAAEVVRAAMAKFGKLYLRDLNERKPKLEKLKREQLAAFDAQFQACCGTEEFTKVADAFVKDHPSVFFRSAAWRTFTHPDGRAWAVRTGATGFELRIGRADDANDPPVVRARESKTPDIEVARLIKEQLAEGFVAQR
jgi:hypothetical protein